MPVEIGQAGALTRLPPVDRSAFSPRGETRSCLEIAHIQQFRAHPPRQTGLHGPYSRRWPTPLASPWRTGRNCRPCGMRRGY